jgi:hypothetical protein
MIINRSNQAQSILRVQPVAPIAPQAGGQTLETRDQQKETRQQSNNNSYVGSDPFTQQLRTISETNLMAGQPFEAFRTENNRVRTGLEARAEETLGEKAYNQIFEREQNTPQVENSSTKNLELPPMEYQINGRDKEVIDSIQLRNENDELFVSYDEYAPTEEPELDLGFYRYETKMAKLNKRDEMLMREPLEPTPPPAFRPAFSQAKDDDFSALPPPKHETLNQPLPAPLRLSKTQTDTLNQTTIRMNDYGAQPIQESAQQTLRTFDDKTKEPVALPQSVIQEQNDATLATQPRTVEDMRTPPPVSIDIPQSQQQANVNREAPVVETTPSSQPMGSFEQLDQLLNGSKQLAQEDRNILNQDS